MAMKMFSTEPNVAAAFIQSSSRPMNSNRKLMCQRAAYYNNICYYVASCSFNEHVKIRLWPEALHATFDSFYCFCK